MAKDIKALIKSLVEVQKCRQDNQITVKLVSVRVETCDREYYAKVNISSEAILISPYDVTIRDSHFRPVHLKGYHEEGDRAITMNLYNEGYYVLHFRTKQQRNRALKRIKILTGSETTSDSASSDTS